MPAAQLAPQRALKSRPIGGGHARLALGRLGSPVGDKLAVCLRGVLGELALASPDLFERVPGAAAGLCHGLDSVEHVIPRSRMVGRARHRLGFTWDVYAYPGPAMRGTALH
ncbi:MAG: hypothetical protein ACTHQQ_21650 [Solirubrobacteraceae bacterium]